MKLENLQMTGSFKERGGCNILEMMNTAERKRGVICASAGNHAQGVALHAKRLSIDATIVMPEATPLTKVQNTRKLGGKVILFGTNYDEAFDEAQRICDAERRMFVHAFDDERVIAGQGTIGLELLEQVPSLDAVVVPIGGGGLAAGVALAIKALRPTVRVYGVQTAVLPSMKAALESGEPTTLSPARTLAEGIAVRRVGRLPFELIQKYVDDIVVVDEEEIAEAMLMLIEEEKTVAEGAGAAALAALVHRRLPLEDQNVAVIVSGGNIDVHMVSRVIERGMVKSGRMARRWVRIADATGSLARLTRLLADVGANIVQIHHDRTFAIDLSEALVELVIETRGFDHIAEVESALANGGYKIERGGLA